MELALLIVLIVLNGVFAMSELALVAARPARLAGASDARSKAVLELKKTPTRFLSTVQIGITSISILNGIVGEAALAGPLATLIASAGVDPQIAGPAATLLVVVGITYFSIVIGELVPKRIAQVAPENIARLVALPMRTLSVVVAPFVWLLTVSTEAVLRLMRMREKAGPPITEEEIHAMLVEGTRAGVIEPDEHDMVRKVLRLDDRRVATFMTPRRDMVTLDSNDSLAANLDRASASQRTRFPVIDAATDDVLGIVDTRRLLTLVVNKDSRPWRDIAEPALFVPETLTGRELLDVFRQATASAALVVDEYGDLQGLVTVTDLLNAISGGLARPERAAPEAVDDSGEILIDGRLAALDLQDMLKLTTLPGTADLSEAAPLPYESVGGMMHQLLGRLPTEGESCRWEQWEFKVKETRSRRVSRILARRVRDNDSNEHEPVSGT